MSKSSKARRDAKKRKQAATDRRQQAKHFVPEPTQELARSIVLEAIAVVSENPGGADDIAAHLLEPHAFLPPTMTQVAARDLVAERIDQLVRHGWGPTDLMAVTRRELSDLHASMVLWHLSEQVRSFPADQVSARWHDELDAAGLAVAPTLDTPAGLAAVLRLAGLLLTLPEIAQLQPPPGTPVAARTSGGGDPKLLARVRALLAKAESTEFDEEAEALSAKAQQLISQHSLDRMLHEDEHGATVTATRRLWLDPPYVFPKGLLVHAVADANHCRSVLSEGLGFCTVLGDEDDLDAVEVLVASLLVQSSLAMRREGRQKDRSGVSRTRSFRQSFLTSYAGRIGERLHDAAEQAVADTGHGGELVPVLHRHDERVRAAAEALFPRAYEREAAVSNAQGWAAGRSAADLAELGPRERLSTTECQAS